MGREDARLWKVKTVAGSKTVKIRTNDKSKGRVIEPSQKAFFIKNIGVKAEGLQGHECLQGGARKENEGNGGQFRQEAVAGQQVEPE